MREIDAILQMRPDLGVLPEQVKEVREQIRPDADGDRGVVTDNGGVASAPLLQTPLTFRGIGERL